MYICPQFCVTAATRLPSPPANHSTPAPIATASFISSLDSVPRVVMEDDRPRMAAMPPPPVIYESLPSSHNHGSRYASEALPRKNDTKPADNSIKLRGVGSRMTVGGLYCSCQPAATRGLRSSQQSEFRLLDGALLTAAQHSSALVCVSNPIDSDDDRYPAALSSAMSEYEFERRIQKINDDLANNAPCFSCTVGHTR